MTIKLAHSRLLALTLVSLAFSMPYAQSQSLENVLSELSTSSQVAPATWKFHNEQEWIVGSIGRDVVEMLAFAADPAKPEATFETNTVNAKEGKYAFTYSLNGDKQTADLTLADFVWAPDNYVPLAQNIIKAAKLTATTPATPPDDFLKTLATTDAAKLLEENTRVSAALSANPLDSGLHEQAAMILLTLAMQENAGCFCDNRVILGRIAAHLALAKALSAGLTPLGQLAETGLNSHSVRSIAVARNADTLEKEPTVASDQAFQSWLRTLRMDSTGDFRFYKKEAKTNMEESLYALAFASNLGSNSITEYVVKNHPDMPVAWLRTIANTALSVETGHQIIPTFVTKEVADLSKDYKSYHGTALEGKDKIVEEMNLTPTLCLDKSKEKPCLVVLSWNNLAGFHARHIVNAIDLQYYFYNDKYGVKEQAKQVATAAEASFGKSHLYAMVAGKYDLDPSQREFVVKRAEGEILADPQIISASNWDSMRDLADGAFPPLSLTRPELWFDPPVLQGTAYCYRDRKYMKNWSGSLADIEKVRAVCQSIEGLSRDWLKKKYGERPTFEQVNEAYGPLLGYCVSSMAEVAYSQARWPDKFIPLEENVAKLQPGSYFLLAEYCALHGRDQEAAKYYEEGIKRSDDSVGIANAADWLIGWRYDHGEKAKAAELAAFAGEVYSYQGLQAQGRYYEKIGNLKEAEQAYKNIMERYDDAAVLLAFYHRLSAKSPVYAKEAIRLGKTIFPAGLKKVTLADYKVAPVDGEEITGQNWNFPDSPLQKNVVIVAVNGYAIHNRKQYNAASNLTTRPILTAIYWDGKKYGETQIPAVNCNRFHLNIKEHARH